VTCCTCGKSVCRGPKCADWRPKDAKWECQLCQSSKESLAHTSSWVAEQMSFNQHKFVYPMRARSEVYIPIVGDGNDSSMRKCGSGKGVLGISSLYLQNSRALARLDKTPTWTNGPRSASTSRRLWPKCWAAIWTTSKWGSCPRVRTVSTQIAWDSIRANAIYAICANQIQLARQHFLKSCYTFMLPRA